MSPVEKAQVGIQAGADGNPGGPDPPRSRAASARPSSTDRAPGEDRRRRRARNDLRRPRGDHQGDVGGCRKPRAALVLQAAEALGVEAASAVVIGGIGADIEAARAAGARGVLVPDARTRPEEVASAPEVAADLPFAVGLVLRGPG